MASTERHLRFIDLCPPSLRKDLLKRLPAPAVKAVCECALNTLKGNVPLTPHQKKKLRAHKQLLRRLADRRVSLFKKKKILVQQGGGFLSVLIPAALSVLSTILHK